MLKAAILYTEELNRLFPLTAYDLKYKYVNCGWSNMIYKPKDDNWQGNEFVSVDKHGRVVGYIAYEIRRFPYNVNNFVIINFTDDKVTFGKDLLQTVMDIFLKFNFEKMNFCVFCGNPVERSYDKMVGHMGGRIAGLYEAEAKLSDGKMYDSKSYEITRKAFLKSKFYSDYERYKNRRGVK